MVTALNYKELGLDEDQANDLLYGAPPEGWEIVEGPDLYEQSRWSTFYSTVVKTPEDTYYSYITERGSTESQDVDFSYDDLEFVKVVPTEVTSIEYLPEAWEDNT
jgi:hypothetical protein